MAGNGDANDSKGASAAPVDALPGLLVAARLWARRAPIDITAVRAVLDEAILALHQHHAHAIPVYERVLADSVLGEAGNGEVLAGATLLSSDVFRTYDPGWLADGDFEALTRWLGTVFVREPAPHLEGGEDLAGWLAALRADGVFVTLSSGTTSTPLLVPRDATTLAALRSNGILYGAMMDPVVQMPASFDCLALTPRAARTGLEAAAAAVAGRAERACHLESGDDAGWDAALDFLRDALAHERAMFVFGPPQRVEELCGRAGDSAIGGLAPGSLVATGGGWKGARPLAPEALAERIERALRVPPVRQVDTYGASELNCMLMRCPHGRYHVPPLLRAVALDPLLVPIEPEPSAWGRLGFLDPFALSHPGFLMPGDVGELVEGRCPCGLDGQAIAGAIDRAVDEPPRGCATAATPEASTW